MKLNVMLRSGYMRKIYTGIDIASDGIKIVVSELFNNKFHVLASTSVPDVGIKKGLIVNREKTVEALHSAIKNIESTIGLRIEEAVVTIPTNDRKLSVVSGTTKIMSDEVTGENINSDEIIIDNNESTYLEYRQS